MSWVDAFTQVSLALTTTNSRGALQFHAVCSDLDLATSISADPDAESLIKAVVSGSELWYSPAWEGALSASSDQRCKFWWRGVCGLSIWRTDVSLLSAAAVGAVLRLVGRA